MSMKITALTMDHGPRIRSYKLLMLALADRADEHGLCWPSRQDLKNRACMSDATITRALRWLEAQGWLQRQKRHNTSNIFRLNVWRLVDAEEAKNATKARLVPEGFSEFDEEKAFKAKAAAEAAAAAEAEAEQAKASKVPASGKPAAVPYDPARFALYRATAKPQETFPEWEARQHRHPS